MRLTRRLREEDPEAGVYAVLYAALVLVLIAFAAIVVDIGAVRQDRRLDRSASDAAALGGASYLLSTGTVNPNKACTTAWQYLSTTLQLNLSSAAITANCVSFPSVYTTCPASEIDQDVTVGDRTIRIAWPVPSTGGSGFLTPDIAPGSAQQPFDSSSKSVDGSAGGCDRLGVAIFHHQKFSLANAFGPSATDTQVHSVALATVSSGPGKVVAALNVLNTKDCSTLRSTGTGQVFVDATINRDGTFSPGTIAVESTPITTGAGKGNCNNNDHIITANGSGAKICANGSVSPILTCDGGGTIYSHALDSGTTSGYAYDSADTTAGRLSPIPRAEGGTHGYLPVTDLYGCNTTRLALCSGSAGAVNYVDRLEKTLGAATPVAYDGSQAPYSNPFTGAFLNASPLGACGTVNGKVVLPARGVVTAAGTSTGNWYCPGGIDIKGSDAVLQVVEGNLVINGDLTIENKTCLVVNTAMATSTATVSCAAANTQNGGTPVATTTTQPTSDSIIYIKGGNFSAQSGSRFLMPQTFVYANGASAGTISINAPTFALWTAPGAGARDVVTGNTLLEQQCLDVVKQVPVEDCMNSRFAKLAYWSDYPGTNTGSSKDTFAGGGSGTALYVVGTFFTPTSYFNLGGQSSLPIVSQFWCDILDVNGGAALPLQPTDAVSVPFHIGSVGLIR